MNVGHGPAELVQTSDDSHKTCRSGNHFVPLPQEPKSIASQTSHETYQPQQLLLLLQCYCYTLHVSHVVAAYLQIHDYRFRLSSVRLQLKKLKIFHGQGRCKMNLEIFWKSGNRSFLMGVTGTCCSWLGSSGPQLELFSVTIRNAALMRRRIINLLLIELVLMLIFFFSWGPREALVSNGRLPVHFGCNTRTVQPEVLIDVALAAIRGYRPRNRLAPELMVYKNWNCQTVTVSDYNYKWPGPSFSESVMTRLFAKSSRWKDHDVTSL